MPRLFGTDGVRGIANLELTGELAYRLGRAAAHCLAPSSGRARIVVGKDTRCSGDMLEAALVAGILSAGADALVAGVLSTPGVAFATRKARADAGAVISASHNPVIDNGIKLFSREGYKISEVLEEAIEQAALATADTIPRPTGTLVGRAHRAPELADMYLERLVSTADFRLDGMHVVVDPAHGATCRLAPALLERLGAHVTAIHASPDGARINVGCGSTNPQAVCRAVIEHQAAIGLALDGDGDRLIAADEHGRVVDGDQILAICGLHLLGQGRLPGRGIVATVMSNLGLDHVFRAHGGRVVRTPVGDRHVLEALLREGMVLGGEQSGHVIFLDTGTTGDGLATAVRLLEVMAMTGQPLSALASRMPRYPQALVNVRVNRKVVPDEHPGVRQAVAEARRRLGEQGRVVLRASGTEPVLRVMAEGEDPEVVEKVAEELAAAIARELEYDKGGDP